MGKAKKKNNFAIILIIVLVAGVGIGAYAISNGGTDRDKQYSTSSTADKLSDGVLRSLMLNGSPRLGSQDAPITIIEFGDYQCPSCDRFAMQIEPSIVTNYIDTGKAKLVFKDFPVYGKDSVNGAIAAHCRGAK